MQFIEHFFGVSPDGGSGALEAGLILLPILLVPILAKRLWRARQNRNPPPG
jgi:hypothetical protein